MESTWQIRLKNTVVAANSLSFLIELEESGPRNPNFSSKTAEIDSVPPQMLDLLVVEDCWHDTLYYVSNIFQRGTFVVHVYPALRFMFRFLLISPFVFCKYLNLSSLCCQGNPNNSGSCVGLLLVNYGAALLDSCWRTTVGRRACCIGVGVA